MIVDWRRCFLLASTSFSAIVSGIDQKSLDSPGLGVWTVRDLIGHTSRALSTIETYLQSPSVSYDVDKPLEYYARAQVGSPEVAQAVAQRGRDAGAELGPDPGAVIAALSQRVNALVATTPDDTGLSVFGSSISFRAYLPTRVFELTVHSLDLSVALDMDPPAELAEPVAQCLVLAAGIAGQRESAAQALLALTGRHALPENYSVV